MNRYILLRDNKENGPYTLEEITAKGFKAYDLIWIEGRSAGWRYPSEIAELKPYAPVVEEQPYDRFYKKSEGQAVAVTEETVLKTDTVAELNPTIKFIHRSPAQKLDEGGQYNLSTEVLTQEGNSTIAERNPLDNQTINPATSERSPLDKSLNLSSIEASMKADYPAIEQNPSKKIYVTLPNNETKPIIIKTEKEKPAAAEKKLIREEKPVYKEPLVQPVINEDPVVLEEKYSRPLDEIKKMYVNTVLQQKKKPASGIIISEKVKLAALAFTLLLSGTAVGLFINRSKSSIPQSIAAVPVQQTGVVSNTEEETNTDNSTVLAEPVKKQRLPEIATQDETNEEPKEEKLTSKKLPVKNTEQVPKTQQVKIVTGAPVYNGQHTASSTIKNPALKEDEEKAIVRKNLGKEINITASNYKKATFGGISDLEFTVYNNTSYVIDMVIAEVEYYTANKKLYKTETVYFKNIAPNGTQVQQAPNSNRGYEIKYRISLISSKELGIYTAGM